MLSVTEQDTLFMFAGPWLTWTTMGRWTCLNFPSQWSWLNWSYRVTPSLLHCPPPWSSHPSPFPHSRLLVRNGWWLEWHVFVFFLMAWMTCTVSGHRWSLRPKPFRLVLLFEWKLKFEKMKFENTACFQKILLTERRNVESHWFRLDSSFLDWNYIRKACILNALF